MDSERLLVMSVTRLADGVCVACLDTDYRWVRPTRQESRDWRQLTIRDLHDVRRRLVVEVGNVVEWPLGKRIPKEVHSEDIAVAGPASLVRRVPPEELLVHCAKVCDRDLDRFLRSEERSLILFQPQNIEGIYFAREGKGGIRARLRLRHGTLTEDLSVTDLQWRAFGRRILDERKRDVLDWSHRALGVRAQRRIWYLVIGRGQPFEEQLHPLAGKFWPFVTTIFTDPPTTEAIDYTQL